MYGQDDNQQQNNNQQWQPQQEPTQGPVDPAISPSTTNTVDEPTVQAPTPSAPPTSSPLSAPQTDEISVAPSNAPTDLLDIKQRALQELSPLVTHLEQNPEEKFKTTMMMIQASDDQSLIPEAYAAAQAITDGKSKAQALLDIVNEINYFTQHDQQN